MGALTAFTTADGNVVVETLVIAGVLATACFASVVMWAAFGTAIARFLTRPHARSAFNGSMASLLVLSLVPVFW
jgi:threonine/homoserine/homoserine lactone efflux protein